MSQTEIRISGTLKPDGTLELDQKPNLAPGRVTIVLRPETAPTAPTEGWWPFMQRVRAEREAAGYPFINEEEMTAHIQWLREGDRSAMRSRFVIYCDMLYCGLVNIRNHADDPERCYAEADHLHNLPQLLRNLDNEDLHKFYWEAMRPSFVSQSRPEWLGRFQQLWIELEEASRREAGQ